MVLDLDFGNSSVKWQLSNVSVGKQVMQGSELSLADLVETLSNRSLKPNVCRISLVRSEKANAEKYLTTLEQAFGCQVYFAEVAKKQQGLSIAYTEPSNLGVDRWLAMLAGWQQYQQALVIIDAGTALTVDFVAAEGQHLGGCIAPGLGLLKQSLDTGSGLASDAVESLALYGQDTHSCIAAGVMGMFNAFVASQANKAQQLLGPDYKVLVTGGDARFVTAVLKGSVLCSDLVMRGLAISIPLGVEE